jgi:hypothetical protein
MGGGTQLTETDGALSLDEAKTLSQSPLASAGLFDEEKQWRLERARMSISARKAAIWRQQFIS